MSGERDRNAAHAANMTKSLLTIGHAPGGLNATGPTPADEWRTLQEIAARHEDVAIARVSMIMRHLGLHEPRATEHRRYSETKYELEYSPGATGLIERELKSRGCRRSRETEQIREALSRLGSWLRWRPERAQMNEETRDEAERYLAARMDISGLSLRFDVETRALVVVATTLSTERVEDADVTTELSR